MEKKYNLCAVCHRKADAKSKTCYRKNCKIIWDALGPMLVKPKNKYVNPFTLDVTNDPSGRITRRD